MTHTSDSVTALAPQIREAIEGAENILLHLHPRPDPDSIGSALAMRHALTALGKKVTLVSGDSPVPQEFAVLPGFDTIAHKTFMDAAPETFDLFIALDAGSKEQVTRVPGAEFPPSLTTVVIDHHVSNTAFGNINLVDSTAAATAEILYYLLKEIGISISPEIAINLLVGIYYDTGAFTTPVVNARTVQAFYELAILVPDFHKTLFSIENSKTPAKLFAEGIALLSVRTYFGGRVAIAAIPHTLLVQRGIEGTELGKISIASKLRSAIGWDIGISLIEERPNFVKISFRTRDETIFDLSKVAVALGGGGHKGASAAVLEDSMEGAREKIIAVLQANYPQLGHP